MDKEMKVTGVRKAMAKHMAMSWVTSPLEGFTVKVDMQAAMDLKNELKKDSEDNDVSITLNHIIIKAVQKALSDFPLMNASFDPEQEVMTIHESINVGMAIDTNDGLIVGNIKNVQRLDYIGVAKAATQLIKNAKSKKLILDDITGGTFTITNLGMLGIEGCFPIINQPELGILGVNKIVNTPVVENGEIVIRPLMTMNLNADHRVIDGAYAAKFIMKIKEYMEDPQKSK